MENIMRKGETAHSNQFLLFSQCFPPYMTLIFHFKCTIKCLQFVLIWTRLKFCCLVKSSEITLCFKIIVGKEEFSPFPTLVSIFQKKKKNL